MGAGGGQAPGGRGKHDHDGDRPGDDDGGRRVVQRDPDHRPDHRGRVADHRGAGEHHPGRDRGHGQQHHDRGHRGQRAAARQPCPHPGGRGAQHGGQRDPSGVERDRTAEDDPLDHVGGGFPAEPAERHSQHHQQGEDHQLGQQHRARAEGQDPARVEHGRRGQPPPGAPVDLPAALAPAAAGRPRSRGTRRRSAPRWRTPSPRRAAACGSPRHLADRLADRRRCRPNAETTICTTREQGTRALRTMSTGRSAARVTVMGTSSTYPGVRPAESPAGRRAAHRDPGSAQQQRVQPAGRDRDPERDHHHEVAPGARASRGARRRW